LALTPTKVRRVLNRSSTGFGHIPSAGQEIGTANCQEGGGAFEANDLGKEQGHVDSGWSTQPATVEVLEEVGLEAGDLVFRITIDGETKPILLVFKEDGDNWTWEKYKIEGEFGSKVTDVADEPYDSGTMTRQ
jgi:hypothetical protein